MFFKAFFKANIAMLFFGTLLVLSAHYRVVPFHAPEPANILTSCNQSQSGTDFPTGVVMYGTDNAPHLFTDKRHVNTALVDQFGQNGHTPKHEYGILAFCH